MFWMRPRTGLFSPRSCFESSTRVRVLRPRFIPDGGEPTAHGTLGDFRRSGARWHSLMRQPSDPRPEGRIDMANSKVNAVQQLPSERQRNPERTRDEILLVATAEFAPVGYSGARVDNITALTRTTKPMIYYYFGGKEQLYVAVLEQAYGDIRAIEQQR